MGSPKIASNSFTKMLLSLVGGKDKNLPWAFISSDLEGYTPQQSAAKRQELASQIKAMGFEPQPANGGYMGLPEKSFFIHGIPAEDATLLGATFGQHSVMLGQGGNYKLVSTRGDAWPESLVEGDARKHLHVLSPDESSQIDKNIQDPAGAKWDIPGFTQLERPDVPKYPGGQKKRITLDPQFSPENRPRLSKWVLENCRLGR